MKTDAFDLVIADLRLEDGNGLELLKQLKQIAPRTQGILMTGYATMDTAVEAIRIGLFDYMIKPILPAQLDLVLQRLESIKQLQSENSYLRQQVQADGEGSGRSLGQKRPDAGHSRNGEESGANARDRFDPGRERHG